MRGERLVKARTIAKRTFTKWENCSPQNYRKHNSNWIGRVYYGSTGKLMSEVDLEEIATVLLGKYRKTKVPCSCYMCGNPRRHFGDKRLKEIRQDLLYQDWLDESEAIANEWFDRDFFDDESWDYDIIDWGFDEEWLYLECHGMWD